MAQNITTHVDLLVAAAERVIVSLSADEAVKLHGRGDVVFVDLRDIRELNREGRVPGAFHCPRGMLEFWIDPVSKYHKPEFAEDKRFVFFCAAGQRSALATETAQRMGLKPVAHVAGGFTAWKAAGGPVEATARQTEVVRPMRLVIGNKNYSSWSFRPWIAMKVAGIRLR